MKDYSRLETVPLNEKIVRGFREKHGTVLYVDIDGSEGYYDRYGEKQQLEAYNVIQRGLESTGFDFIRTDFKKEYEVPGGGVSIRDEPAFLVAGGDKNSLLTEIEKAIQNSEIADKPFKITIYPWKD